MTMALFQFVGKYMGTYSYRCKREKNLKTEYHVGYNTGRPFYFIVVFLILFQSCDNSGVNSFEGSYDNSSDRGSLNLKIVWKDSDSGVRAISQKSSISCENVGVSTIQAKVYNQKNIPLVDNHKSWFCSDHGALIEDVPPGSDLKVVILGRDENGSVLYRGEQAGIHVKAGQNSDIVEITAYSFVPALSYPENETILTGNTLDLQWNAVKGASDFGIIISKNEDLSSPILDDKTKNNQYILSGLIDNIYYWCVWSIDFSGMTSLRSNTGKFTLVTSDADLYVDGKIANSGNGKSWETAFKTIQEAVDIAADGEIIDVRSGTYSGDGNTDIDFYGKGITLRSESGPDTTIINCENKGRGFIFSKVTTLKQVVDGFSITNGYADNGGALYVEDSNPIIKNCIISYCKAARGGGIYTQNSILTIINSRIYNNEAQYGGGIRFNNSSPELINCKITNNKTTDDGVGGGIGWWNDSNLGSSSLTKCTISDNQSTNNGGGIFMFSASPAITNCVINNNYSNTGGGLHCQNSTSIISSCMFTDNNAAKGAGILCENGSPKIFNSIFTGNSATNLGGAVCCANYGQPSFINCTIFNNQAGNNGGGLATDGYPPQVTLTNSILWNNTPDEILLSPDATFTIMNCDIEGSIPESPAISDAGGNINQNPIFLDTLHRNFHLSENSPCIDSGTNSISEIPSSDFEGSARIVDGNGDDDAVIDIGAYEYF